MKMLISKLIFTMNKVVYYLARVLSAIVVLFFGVFILEGFSPKFNWQDSLSHLFLTLVVLGVSTTAWKWPKIGGLIFVVLGCSFIIFFSRAWLSTLIIGGTLLITGVLFIIDGFKKK
jgi:hypothetical protein